ncbi:MAG: 5,10-methylenetetrahydrofolate reductase, partial [Deltaproteobacteria bacterium]|nr:5,10-methylenetetrahydrofolate reductase [Deltaproteobacteria bacterium]
MKLSEYFGKEELVITSEVGPVKGCVRDRGGAPPPCLEEAKGLAGMVHAVNVTDNQSAVMRLGSLAASVLLKQSDIE